jgi:crotonobetainyl-CoA:carnitine CoA-transferase CaiB-like acyl-CoA transferase
MVAINTSIVNYGLTGKFPYELRRDRSNFRRLGGFKKVKDGWISLASNRLRAQDNLKKKLRVEEVSQEDLEEFLSGMDRYEAVEAFAQLGFAVGPVYSVKEVVRDPHIKERGTIVKVNHPNLGEVTTPNFPVKYSETFPKLDSPAPNIGQHNNEILIETLGYTEEEVADLEKNGIILTQK